MSQQVCRLTDGLRLSGHRSLVENCVVKDLDVYVVEHLFCLQEVIVLCMCSDSRPVVKNVRRAGSLPHMSKY